MTDDTIRTIFVPRTGLPGSYDALGFDIHRDGLVMRHAVQFGENLAKDGPARRAWINRGVEVLQAWLNDKCDGGGAPRIILLPPLGIDA